jgi:hypothetical protein
MKTRSKVMWDTVKRVWVKVPNRKELSIEELHKKCLEVTNELKQTKIKYEDSNIFNKE